MQKNIIKIVVIQFLIILLYLGLTSYEFVSSRDLNPVGVGFQQWALIIIHFLVTGFIGLYMISKSKNRPTAKKKLMINLASIVVIILIYYCFSESIWHWLWSFRKDVIQ
jgi:uncharacterized membrane protein